MTLPLHALVPLALLLAVRPAPQDAEGTRQAELEALTAEIRAQVEELRGLAFEHPVKVAVTDRAGLVKYLRAYIDASTAPGELEALDAAAKLAGLLGADEDYVETFIDLAESQVAGFYDPPEDAFYLMSTVSGDLARITLAHELTHALDDQHYDLDGKMEELRGDSDALFAFHAVVEGSGTVVMNRWTLDHVADLDKDALEELQAMGQQALADASPFLWKPLLGAYMRGSAFLNRTTSVMGGQMMMPAAADVDRAFREPPRSSEQILHPDKYWDPEARDDPQEVRPRFGELPEGWEVLWQDTWGELGLALVIEPPAKRKGLDSPLAVLGAKYTSRAAEGWGGDRWMLLGKGEARALVTATVWDTPQDAREFERAMGGDVEAHVRAGAARLAGALGLAASGYLRSGGERSFSFASFAADDAQEVQALFDALEVDPGGD